MRHKKVSDQRIKKEVIQIAFHHFETLHSSEDFPWEDFIYSTIHIYLRAAYLLTAALSLVRDHVIAKPKR